MRVFALFGRPAFLRTFHLVCTVLWIPFTALSAVLGWLSSVTFVAAMSMIALFLGSFSAYQAARVEVTQDEEIAKD